MPYLKLPVVLSCTVLPETGLHKEVKKKKKKNQHVGPSPAFEIKSYVTLRNALTSWIWFPSLWNGQEEEEMRACI